MNLNCRAIDEIKVSQEIRELSLLLRIYNKLSEFLDLKKVLKPILPMMAVHTEMRSGALFLLKKSTGELVIEERYGVLDKEQMNVQYGSGKGILGKVIETGHPAITLRMSNEPLPLDITGSRKTFDKNSVAFIGVPIKIGKNVIGCLVIDSLFNNLIPLEEDLRLMTLIASIIARAAHLRELAEVEQERLLEENRRLQRELRVQYRQQSIIGDSKVMQNIGDFINTVAPTHTTVLLIGESGVGKERIAKAIHSRSNRSGEAFIKVVCTALPGSLIERELFGYEKGAIQGAAGWHRGSLEIAAGGTIFLDEVSALTPLLQAKLLRILKERQFERIGGNKPITVDARIIAATNQNLEARMQEGTFSKDLYYQLAVFPIIVPPLRKRREDIILLANFFIEQYAKEIGKDMTGISPSAVDLLMHYQWPGNIQELKGCIERAIIVSADGMIHHHHLPPSVQGSVVTAQGTP